LFKKGDKSTAFSQIIKKPAKMFQMPGWPDLSIHANDPHLNIPVNGLNRI